jgi:hypothetical protein
VISAVAGAARVAFDGCGLGKGEAWEEGIVAHIGRNAGL